MQQERGVDVTRGAISEGGLRGPELRVCMQTRE